MKPRGAIGFILNYVNGSTGVYIQFKLNKSGIKLFIIYEIKFIVHFKVVYQIYTKKISFLNSYDYRFYHMNSKLS
jgi:hypothetical protein